MVGLQPTHRESQPADLREVRLVNVLLLERLHVLFLADFGAEWLSSWQRCPPVVFTNCIEWITGRRLVNFDRCDRTVACGPREVLALLTHNIRCLKLFREFQGAHKVLLQLSEVICHLLEVDLGNIQGVEQCFTVLSCICQLFLQLLNSSMR